MRILNYQYRGIDRTTDVLSFPQISDPKILRHSTFCILNSKFVLGDIVINLHQAQRQAKIHGHSLYRELNILLIHGLLHLIHYDHEKSIYHKKKMKILEKKLLSLSFL